VIVEEIYTFNHFNPDRVRLLVSRRNPDMPISWWKDYGRGHVFYTALGHRSEVWSEPWFQAQIGGAIDWILSQRTPPRLRAVAR
jgi:type 1 glutamine amidotransferase